MTRLIDTNILVYRFDPRDARKQSVAEKVLSGGLAKSDVVLPHQAIVEFIAAVTRSRPDLGDAPLLTRPDALLEAESLMAQFPVVYPDAEILRSALRGCATYFLSWFDAHLWAYAEALGIPEIVSEDFEHGRHYGQVRVVNPFLPDGVQELPAMYASEAS